MCSSPKLLSQALFLLPILVGMGSQSVQADWKVKEKANIRWLKIARGLERQFLRRPQRSGYLLRRLVRHYRKRGGYKALIRRLSSPSTSPKVSHKKRQLALALVALRYRDTQRAIAWLRPLLSPHLQRHLILTASLLPVASRPPSPRSRPTPGKSHKKLRISRYQRRLIGYWAKAQWLSQQWLNARRAYALLLTQRTSRKSKKKLYQKLLLLDEKSGRWSQVEKHYRALITLSPRDASLRQARARVLLRLGQERQALQELRAATRTARRQQKLRIWLQMVHLHLLLKQNQQALKSMKTIRRNIVPQHWMHRVILVLEQRAHRQQKTLPLLLKQYQKRAVKQAARYLPLIPKLQQELRRDQAAVTSYRTLLKRYPKHPMLRDFVKLLHRLRDYSTAQRLLEKRIEAEPNDRRWNLALLTTLHLSQQKKKRDQRIAQWVKTYGSDRSFLYRILQKSESWSLSSSQRLTMYQRLCSLPPHSVNCYVRWGDLLWSDKKKNRALSVWKLILRVKPTHPSHWLTLARIYQKHNRLLPSQRLLERLRKSYPRYHRAQEELAEIYLQRRQPQRAIPILKQALRRTRSLKRRKKLRDTLLRAMMLRDHHSILTPYLLTQYMLNPMRSEPRKLLITYYLRHSYRFRPDKRKFLGRRFFYHRWFGSKKRPSYDVQYRPLKISIPRNIQAALYEGLQIYPNDTELHEIAVEVYRKQSIVLYHLYRLMLLHPGGLSRYIKEFRQGAHRFGRMKLFLPLLQRLTRRYPNRPALWSALGREALRQKNPKLAKRSYKRALNLDTKSFVYFCGMAQTFGYERRWKRALKSLLLYRAKLSKRQQNTRTRHWIHYALRAGIRSTRLYPLLQEQWRGRPGQALDVLYAMYQNILPTEQRKARQFFHYILKRSQSVWRVHLKSSASKKQRLQALTLLYLMAPGSFLRRLPALLQDSSPSIRAMGALAVARYKKRDMLTALDRLERTDPNRMVRATARFASATLLNKVRSYRFISILQPNLWQTWLLPLLVKQSFTGNNLLPKVAQIYPVLPLYLQRHIFATLRQMPAQVVSTINHMLTYSQHRCFSYAVLANLRHQGKSQAVRQAAKAVILPQRFFRYYCSLKSLSPPTSAISVHACYP